MVVREHSAIDSIRESIASLLRMCADAVSPRPDPLKTMLDSAPWDDEPLTSEERESVEASWSEYQAGNALTLDEVEREFS
jgi:hypothetical protein